MYVRVCVCAYARTHVCRKNDNIRKEFSNRNKIDNDYMFSLDTEPSSVHVIA